MQKRYLLAARSGCTFAYAALPSSLAKAAACSRCGSVSLVYLNGFTRDRSVWAGSVYAQHGSLERVQKDPYARVARVGVE